MRASAKSHIQDRKVAHAASRARRRDRLTLEKSQEGPFGVKQLQRYDSRSSLEHDLKTLHPAHEKMPSRVPDILKAYRRRLHRLARTLFGLACRFPINSRGYMEGSNLARVPLVCQVDFRCRDRKIQKIQS
jgi:hypothetical protein